MDGHNPLTPSNIDIVWSAIAILAVALAAFSLVLLARSARQLTIIQGLAWVFIIFAVPVLGPSAWLTVGRRTLHTRNNTQKATVR